MVYIVWPSVAFTYKHVIYCYTAENDCNDICMSPPFFAKYRVISNQIAAQFTRATKRYNWLWTEYYFNRLTHIKKIFFLMISQREFISGWYVITKGTPFLFLSLLLASLILNLTFLISEFISFSGYFLITNHDLIFPLFRSKSLLLEHNVLIRKVLLKAAKRLV